MGAESSCSSPRWPEPRAMPGAQRTRSRRNRPAAITTPSSAASTAIGHAKTASAPKVRRVTALGSVGLPPAGVASAGQPASDEETPPGPAAAKPVVAQSAAASGRLRVRRLAGRRQQDDQPQDKATPSQARRCRREMPEDRVSIRPLLRMKHSAAACGHASNHNYAVIRCSDKNNIEKANYLITQFGARRIGNSTRSGREKSHLTRRSSEYFYLAFVKVLGCVGKVGSLTPCPLSRTAGEGVVHYGA